MTENEDNKKQNVHTLKSDAEKYIKEKNISLADIALAEKKKSQSKEKKGGKKISLFLTLLIAAAIGIFGIYFVYGKFFKTPVAEEKKEKQPAPYVFSDKITPVALDKTVLREFLEKILKENYPNGDFIYFPLIKEKNIFETKDLLKEMNFGHPKELADFLDANFNFLVHSGEEGGQNSFIFIFKTKNYKPSYAAMLYWEKDLVKDFKFLAKEQRNEKLFTPRGEDGLANSTSSVEAAVEARRPKKFYSKLVNNIDIREADAEDGKTILVYGFFAEKYLIITNSETTFKQTVERLKI